MTGRLWPWLLIGGIACAGCAARRPPIVTVPHVDLPRFMGDWYVIANIPTFVEKDAYNAVESYRLDADGTVATTFTFRQGGFDGKLKRYRPRGFVLDERSNAVWGMQFVWPFKGDFRIVYLDAVTMLARGDTRILNYVGALDGGTEKPDTAIESLAKSIAVWRRMRFACTKSARWRSSNSMPSPAPA